MTADNTQKQCIRKVEVNSIRCPSCGALDASVIGELPKGRIFAGRVLDTPLSPTRLFRCDVCYLKFRHPLLTAEEYGAMYNNGKTDFWTTREERGDFQLVSRYVMENLTAGARVLDFGCYTGDLLTLLNDKPYEKYGVELNRGAAEMARTKTGAQVVDSLEQLPEVLRFDSILAVDVIEHLPDPLALIRSLLGRLKDGGTLLITTGDGENWFWNVAGSGWWYCALPEHIAFISKKWLEEREQKHREPWHVVECRKFAYQRLTLGAWASSAVRAVLLAAFGENYLASMSRLKQIVGRGGALNVGGGGLLKDHLFVVLRAIKVTNQP